MDPRHAGLNRETERHLQTALEQHIPLCLPSVWGFLTLQHIRPSSAATYWLRGASRRRPPYKIIPKRNLQTPGGAPEAAADNSWMTGGDPVRVHEGTGGGASASASWRPVCEGAVVFGN